MFAPVSVVIPCYQCAAVIERAVNSVANQTCRPVELILVEDASGDGTLKIIHRLKEIHGDWVIPAPQKKLHL